MSTDPIPSNPKPTTILRARYDEATVKGVLRVMGPRLGPHLPSPGTLAMEQRRWVTPSGFGVVATIRPYEEPLPGRCPRYGTTDPQRAEWIVSPCRFTGEPYDLAQGFAGARYETPKVVHGPAPQGLSLDHCGTCYVTQESLDEVVADLLAEACAKEGS